MGRIRLNLATLRGNRLPGRPAEGATLDHLLASEGGLTLSRRELLGLAGVAVLTVPPLSKRFAVGLLGAFHLRRESNRVAFCLGSHERWVIDARRFGGTPRLEVTEQADLVRVRLVGATWPGTRLPADLTAAARRALSGWRLRLQFAWGRLDAQVPLEAWLAGAEPARARGQLEAATVPLPEGSALRLGGTAQLEFRPDWSLRLQGPQIAALTLPGADLSADTVTLALLAPEAPSLLQEPARRRLVFTLERGNRDWPLGEALAAAHGQYLTAGARTFDTLALEAGETMRGTPRYALAAQGTGEEGAGFRPGGGLRDSEGNEFALPLRNPRFAIAFDGTTAETALVADYPETPVWMRLDGCSLRLGQGPAGSTTAVPFESVAHAGRSPRLRCEPALLGVAAALPGALVEARPAEEGARVALLAPGAGTAIPAAEAPPRGPTTTAQPQPTPPTGRVTPAATRPAASLVLPPLVLSVLRPDDLLALTFRFVNLRLQAQTGKPSVLTRPDATKPAYVIVEFPPQHVCEEALFEADAAYPVSRPPLPAGTPPDPDAGKQAASDTDPFKGPPLKARLAGASRLAFRIPDTIKEIPYTLPALLDWSKWDLSVSPRALPGPLPPRFKVVREGGKARVLAPADLGRLAPRATTPPAAPLPGTVTPRAGTTPAASASASAQPTPGVALPLQALSLSPQTLAALAEVRAPGEEQTAIEAPYRLLLSPNQSAGFLHALQPVTRAQRTELWHTRLGVKAENGHLFDLSYEYAWDGNSLRVVKFTPDEDPFDALRTVRAVWSPDYAPTPPPHNNLPFRASLDRHDRCELVMLTSDWKLPDCLKRVVDARRLMLSSLGAWLDTRYGAELPLGKGLSVEEWRHIATMGRDQYVRVVYKGYLFPFGHRASLVKVTERKFERLGNQSYALLRQRMFIVVREPEKTYPAYGQANDGRAIPFRRVRLTTLITPNLGKPENSAALPPNYSAQAGFWPIVGTEPFPFHYVAEDWDGQRSEFLAPAIFVGVESVPGTNNSVAFDAASSDLIIKHYLLPQNETRRKVEMRGQKVALAESKTPGDTSLELTRFTLGAEREDKSKTYAALDLEKNNQPRFYPTLQRAEVRLTAVAQATGAAGTTAIVLHSDYVTKGWAGNPGEVFAAIAKETPIGLNFSPDQAGGLAVPNLAINALSRQFGPVGGDVTKFATGGFDPASFFGDSALLFGVIPLQKIIEALFGALQIPKLNEEIEKDAAGVPKAVTVRYGWNPQIKSWPNAQKPIFEVKAGARLSLEAVLRVDLRGGPPTAMVKGRLPDFAINLVPAGDIPYFIRVTFKNIGFTSEAGKKVDFTAEMGDFVFGGPLKFINTLKDLIPLSGFSDPPYLDVSSSGVTAGFSLALPGVGVGVFSLQNISLTAELRLPFIGKPLSMYFAFCKRESPFLLTVAMFGGGGFVGLEVNPAGLVMVEASLEFGGNFAFDIGVASGGVYVMAGIYFKLEGSEVTLTGYLRMGGALSILGLITISLELYLGLTYQSAGNQVWGQAKVTVEIELLFFSIGVSFTVERQFSGSSSSAALPEFTLAALGDQPSATASQPGALRPLQVAVVKPPHELTFKDLMKQEDWKTYCEAFG